MGTVQLMPWSTVWTPVIGSPTEAFWGGGVADSVVMRFADLGQRNTWLNPPKGAVCVMTNVTGSTLPTMWMSMGGSSGNWQQIGPSILRAPATTAQTIASALTISGRLSLTNANQGNDANDAVTVGYMNESLSAYVKLDGSRRMTDWLLLPMKEFPTDQPNAAAPAKYVNAVADLKLDKTGGTITGSLTINDHANPAKLLEFNVGNWGGNSDGHRGLERALDHPVPTARRRGHPRPILPAVLPGRTPVESGDRRVDHGRQTGQRRRPREPGVLQHDLRLPDERAGRADQRRRRTSAATRLPCLSWPVAGQRVNRRHDERPRHRGSRPVRRDRSQGRRAR